MTSYDIFNGDADGICALLQLRLAEPRTARLVTGVKRDINLLDELSVKAGDSLTVLDISMRTNMKGLNAVLDAGAHVFYVDHHNAGDIPKHENLLAVIDTRPTICTSLLVNKCLKGMYAQWALVGAYGDNMFASAQGLADTLKLHSDDQQKLKDFGRLINYNAYGSEVTDLHYTPAELYTLLYAHTTPLACLQAHPEIYETLDAGFKSDFAKATQSQSLAHTVILLDDAPWARRISGNYATHMAVQDPDAAHALLTHNTDGGYTVSVRAPLNAPTGTGTFCEQFPTGGGRAAAGGINHLPKDQLDLFLKLFHEQM